MQLLLRSSSTSTGERSSPVLRTVVQPVVKLVLNVGVRLFSHAGTRGSHTTHANPGKRADRNHSPPHWSRHIQPNHDSVSTWPLGITKSFYRYSRVNHLIPLI